MLQIKNIVKDYGDKDNIVHALKGINLNFRDCELVSILGQSGCGKTTLLNIIGGLDRYTSGDLIIDGVSTKNYKDVDWDTYRNVRVGFIFQSYNLIMHTDIVSNVEMALTLSGVNAKERRERAIKALEQVGLKDQIYKKPNQLSGGQMQRVSIARALINNPEILLADEPTGALDSATSIQIMDMIKEIAKDRLVIMVTHNPELAEKYSTRIVRLSDGEVVSDNNPYDINEEIKDEVKDLFASTPTKEEKIVLSKKEERKINKEKKKKLAKTSMSFLTALKLSFNNLMTKKGRTILTSIAASIGIIGVSLVLAVSNGFSVYINKMQKDMMAGYPITIAQSGIDMATMTTLAMGQPAKDSNVEYANSNTVSTYNSIKKLTDMAAAMQKNNITEEYVEYLNTNLPKDSYGSIYCSYGMTMNIIGKPNVKIFNDTKKLVEMTPGAKQYASMIFSGDPNSEYQNIPNMSMMFALGELTGGKEFVESQYDCLYGSFPVDKTQMVLIVNESNQIGEFTMSALGLDPKQEYTFEEIIAHSKANKMKAYANNEYYYYDSEEDYYKANDFETLYNSETDCVELEIVGIYRAKKDVSYATMSTGIHYSTELTQYILNKNYDSEVVQAQRDKDEYVLALDHKYPSSASDSIGSMFGAGMAVTDQESSLLVLGGLKTPIEVSIYPVNFEAKAQITSVLDKWNQDHSKDEQITYTDMASMIASMLSQMIKIITIALVCFSAVSLFVSSFMIAIITYVSVVERTKEIGILRALGARKIDISRVFNAETGIIGLVAGVIGVVITYILSIPINIIVNIKAGMVLNLCSLNPLTALAMIGLSIVLTLIAGLIPSRMAAKKDPVVALRTE